MQPFQDTYEILSTLGRGGMGSVYLARHKRLGTLWAIKEVDRSRGAQVDLMAEANILKRLNHPLLPRIIDIYEGYNAIYVVEDYIEGVSLDKHLREAGRFPEKQVREWMVQLCGALMYLHSQQPNPIIYRDLKPSNIMVTPTWDIKLIDFGIAREFKKESLGDTAFLGTRGYAAPEQFGTSQTDVRTDIYSFGVTVYHAVTGRSPNEPPYELRPVREWDSSLSEGMEYIIGKCTRQDPSERYQSAAELMRDIRSIDSFSTANKRRRVTDVLKIVGCTVLILGGIAIALLGVFQAQTEKALAYQAEYDRGLEYIDRGDVEDAERVLTAADEEYGKSTGHLAMVVALLNSGDYEECAKYAKETAEKYPEMANNAELNYCWAMALDGTGDMSASLRKLIAANRIDPDNVKYMQYLARAYAKSGDVSSARGLMDELRQTSNDSSTAFVHAIILQEQGDDKQAAQEYNYCIEMSDDKELRLAAFRELAQLYKGERSERLDAVSDEIAILQEMQRTFPNDEQAFAYESLGDAYFAKGTQDGDVDAFNAACANFRKLVELGYGRTGTFLNIAIIEQRLQRYDEAKQVLAELLDRYPNNADAYIQLAFIAAEQETSREQSVRDYSDVLKYYQRAVECGGSGENLQRLEGIVNDLRSGGWL